MSQEVFLILPGRPGESQCFSIDDIESVITKTGNFPEAGFYPITLGRQKFEGQHWDRLTKTAQYICFKALNVDFTEPRFSMSRDKLVQGHNGDRCSLVPANVLK